jgi:hypothetical protein
MNYLREILLEKMGGKCVQCGSTKALEFDHINPKTKSFNISAGYNKPKEILEKELSKCQLLCNKCHIEKTKKDNKNCRPNNLNGGRPPNYKFLGKTDRMRVPYSRHLTIIFNELERVAQLGYDPAEYLEEFVDRLQQVE